MLIIGTGLVFVILGVKIPDSDFGWHYRLGEIIAKSGIPATDPFSYTMPSYPFVDYEWGTNLIWYWLYPAVGVAGLAAVYAAMAMAAPLIALPGVKKEYKLWLAVLAWTVMVFRFGVRAQVISWAFVAVIARWVFNSDLWEKERKWYPWLMLLWVNMHGSYILGTGVMGVWLGLRDIEKKTFSLKDWLFWGAGTAVTLINPYGMRNWREVVRQISQARLNSEAIGEWQPFYAKFDPAMWLTAVLAAAGWWQERNKPGSRAKALVVLIFFAGALFSLRHAPLFVVIALPLAAGAVTGMEKATRGNKDALIRWQKFKQIMRGLAGIVLTAEMVMALFQAKDFINRWYPVAAVEYLKSHGYQGRIFNRYGWGGYLIWKIPGQRFFIDGRMSNFFWKAPTGESDQAFLEYLDIKRGKTAADAIFNKYNIRAVLWTAQKQPGEADLVENLTREGWKTIYRDQTAVILTRPDKL
jgi:hypothetical protein